MTDSMLFGAPWDQKLKLITGLVTGLLLGSSAFIVWLALARVPSVPIRFFLLANAMIPVAVLAVCALMGPSGYAICDRNLRIDRRLYPIEIPLASIQEVSLLPPEQLAGAWRTLGTGGLFGYYGKFRNKLLGDFRMYATRGVGHVLVRAGRPYVLTPDSPERFVEALKGRMESVRPDEPR